MSHPNVVPAFTHAVSLSTASTRFAPLCHRTTLRITVRTHSLVRACLPAGKDKLTSDAESTAENSPPMSNSEKMAALLGQDPAHLKAKAEQLRQEIRNENIRKYTIAFVTTVVSTALFFVQKANPAGSLNLMTFLKDSSAPVEVVGSNGLPSMIEFSATWCTNCKAMAPRVFDLQKEFAGRVNFVVVDGDDPARQEIIEKYGVDGVPQFSMVAKDGNVRGNLIGMVPKEALESDLNALLDEKSLPFPGVSLEELTKPYS